MDNYYVVINPRMAKHQRSGSCAHRLQERALADTSRSARSLNDRLATIWRRLDRIIWRWQTLALEQVPGTSRGNLPLMPSA
jgi:hypothetical protein